MEITNEKELVNYLKDFPEKIITINLSSMSYQHSRRECINIFKVNNTIDLSKCINLESIEISDYKLVDDKGIAQITIMNLLNCVSLKNISYYGHKHHHNIKFINIQYCNNMTLTNYNHPLDLSQCINLTNIKLYNHLNPHKYPLDLSNCVNLTDITLSNYNHPLDFSKCINLKSIDIDDTNYPLLNIYNHPLDLSNCVNLTDIKLNNYNHLLDFSKCINLKIIVLPSYTHNLNNISHLKKLTNITLHSKNTNTSHIDLLNNNYLLRDRSVMKSELNELIEIQNKQLQEQNQKILKLEEQLQHLTDIISNLKTNTSYFT
jgi:hypothetical protein